MVDFKRVLGSIWSVLSLLTINRAVAVDHDYFALHDLSGMQIMKFSTLLPSRTSYSKSFGVYSNIWLAKWSKANITDDSTRDLYLGIYSALGLGQGRIFSECYSDKFDDLFPTAIFTLVGAITMALGTLVASQFLHKVMLERILRCPMSFFDTTPIGRIVNRFAKDVDTVDNALPNTIRSALTCFLAVNSNDQN